MENKFELKSLFLPLAILIGLSLLGLFVFKGMKTFSDKDRVVTVKGLAEMNMTATAATVSLSFSFSGDNLQDILKQSEYKKTIIGNYLASVGYDKSAIKINSVDVIDRQKYYETQWQNNLQVQVKIDRYTVSQSLTFQSKDVKSTEDKIAKMKLDLISKDLTCSVSTDYSFPDLNSIKPQLIAESTKNARIAGEQFANDSQAKLGKIKTASQGQISIAGQSYSEEEVIEKPQEPFIQKARVVSSIVFFLE